VAWQIPMIQVMSETNRVWKRPVGSKRSRKLGVPAGPIIVEHMEAFPWF